MISVTKHNTRGFEGEGKIQVNKDKNIGITDADRKTEQGVKVVINKCFGGFSLSLAAQRAYANRKGITLFFYHQTKYKHADGFAEYERISEEQGSSFTHAHRTDHGPVFNGRCDEECYYYPEIPRDDADLVSIVEEMGDRANGDCAELKIVVIPGDVEFEIDEYDGMEHIAEKHRTWG